MDRPLLYSVEAEEWVLGSLLADPTAVVRVANIVAPEDFQLDRHSVIYRAALDMYHRDSVIDVVSLIAELQSTKKLEAAGTSDYISHLYAQVPTGVHAEYYAQIVAKHSRQRALLKKSKAIEDLAYEPDVDAAVAKAIGLLIENGRSTMRS